LDFSEGGLTDGGHLSDNVGDGLAGRSSSLTELVAEASEELVEEISETTTLGGRQAELGNEHLGNVSGEQRVQGVGEESWEVTSLSDELLGQSMGLSNTSLNLGDNIAQRTLVVAGEDCGDSAEEVLDDSLDVLGGRSSESLELHNEVLELVLELDGDLLSVGNCSLGLGQKLGDGRLNLGDDLVEDLLDGGDGDSLVVGGQTEAEHSLVDGRLGVLDQVGGESSAGNRDAREEDDGGELHGDGFVGRFLGYLERWKMNENLVRI
jgi:hypothetical protein